MISAVGVQWWRELFLCYAARNHVSVRTIFVLTNQQVFDNNFVFLHETPLIRKTKTNLPPTPQSFYWFPILPVPLAHITLSAVVVLWHVVQCFALIRFTTTFFMFQFNMAWAETKKCSFSLGSDDRWSQQRNRQTNECQQSFQRVSPWLRGRQGRHRAGIEYRFASITKVFIFRMITQTTRQSLCAKIDSRHRLSTVFSRKARNPSRPSRRS